MDKYDHLFKIQAVFQNSISTQSVQLSTRYIQAAMQAIMIDFLKQKYEYVYTHNESYLPSKYPFWSAIHQFHRRKFKKRYF